MAILAILFQQIEVEDASSQPDVWLMRRVTICEGSKARSACAPRFLKMIFKKSQTFWRNTKRILKKNFFENRLNVGSTFLETVWLYKTLCSQSGIMEIYWFFYKMVQNFLAINPIVIGVLRIPAFLKDFRFWTLLHHSVNFGLSLE